MKRYRLILIVFALAGLIVLGMAYYHLIYPNTAEDSDSRHLFIGQETDYFALKDSLVASGIIRNITTFDRVARRKSYDKKIVPGKYKIPPSVGNNRLINLLRSGSQEPVDVTIINYRTINDVAAKVSGYIKADSSSIVKFFEDESNYTDDGFTRETIISVIIPDTYQFMWNSSAEVFYKRMLREYKTYWDEEKLEKAKAADLTPLEVSILASIIDDEVVKNDEKPRIAGVYINRLRNGIPLQACPTIRFALNDFTIKRVLTVHLKVDSPYNTYKYRGFPPGPIRIASKSGIEAVLNAEKHGYYYFVAKSDFSGYHHFSRTLSEHNRYAAIYQRELNKLRIYK